MDPNEHNFQKRQEERDQKNKEIFEQIQQNVREVADTFIGEPIEQDTLHNLMRAINSQVRRSLNDWRYGMLDAGKLHLMTDEIEDEMYLLAAGLPCANKDYDVFHRLVYIGKISRTDIVIDEYQCAKWEIKFKPKYN